MYKWIGSYNEIHVKLVILQNMICKYTFVKVIDKHYRRHSYRNKKFTEELNLKFIRVYYIN